MPLGLALSPTKTHVTTFLKGFTFLGFDVTSHSVKMRAKSVENFKTKVKDITTRSHNLDAAVVTKLNSVMRGVQHYFGTWFSTCVTQFRELDEWVRMRLRCQKLKGQVSVKGSHPRRCVVTKCQSKVVSVCGACFVARN